VTRVDDTAGYCADLVAGIADAGVDTVFISPGSRNTPLTLAFAAETRIRDLSIRDERSAGFAAVGYGKTTGRPAAVLCTSGSAATHYFPAIVEADQAGVSMVVLTADRPARLRGTSAPQTMDQINLYGSHVKAFDDLPVGGDDGRRDGHRLVETSILPPQGPVHGNASFDEPLLSEKPVSVPQRLDTDGADVPADSPTNAMDGLAGKKILMVAGGPQRPGFGDAVNRVAGLLLAPVLADPQCWVTGEHTIANSDLLATSREPFELHRPDVVLRLGPLPTSKPLWNWLERSGVDQVLVDQSRFTDPLGTAATVLDADPTSFLRSVIADQKGDPKFLNAWLAMDATVGAATDKVMRELTFPNEPQIARTLVSGVPAGSIIYVGSSMPIRDVDTFGEPRSDLRILANRGVNGIDGTISSALGSALSGAQVTLLLGDVAALHDATALSEAARLGAPLRIIVINNDGGGIFSFLPQARSDHVDSDTFEQHWGTPHGLSLSTIADSLGLSSTVVNTLDDYATAVSGPIIEPELIELVTNRNDNVAIHQSIRSASRTAMSLWEPTTR
jgi:2-succinyl-5-enolpyruvyl-6-hydroxy-3-cyclohexene-1-carboxylate synthase